MKPFVCIKPVQVFAYEQDALPSTSPWVKRKINKSRDAEAPPIHESHVSLYHLLRAVVSDALAISIRSRRLLRSMKPGEKPSLYHIP